MNTPVNFELGELLLKKGFKKEGYLQKVWLGDSFEGDKVTSIYGLGASSVLPPISEVVMWLYEKYEIWIEVSVDVWHTKLATFQIVGGKNSYDQPYHYEPEIHYDSPEEAYESAIDYTLKNLI